MRKLTPWYPGHVKPVQPGVYQRKYGWRGGLWYCRFDGKQWFRPRKTVRQAATSSKLSGEQYIPWRGLAAYEHFEKREQR